MRLSAAQLLEKLVSIPSVNPMGADVSEEPYGEERLGEFVAEYLRGLGLELQRVEGPEGRHSIYARYDAGRKETVLLEAHLDTVAPDPADPAPFTPRIENGRVYGRGACDTKGSLAAMLTVVAEIVAMGTKPPVNIVFAASADEEYGMTGARALGKELEGRVDFALVGEPTQLKPALSHKGVIRWRLEVRGKGAHAATPHLGENAIYRAARLVTALEGLADEVRSSRTHPELGTGTLSVGTIRGGTGVNTVPQQCTVEIDRRYLPQDTREAVEKDVLRALALACPREYWSLQRLPPAECPPLDTPADLPWVERLQKALAAEGLPPDPIVLPYATNAAGFAMHGIPAVIIGPGDGHEAHTRAESIALAELDQAVRLFRRFLV